MRRERDKVSEQLRMLECLSLAGKGAGYVSPNPMVGALVVKDGKQVGSGYHRKFGGPHAEVFAIGQAGKAARGATLIVNLEPCSYHGKTPPCTDLIIRSGIRRVVVGMKDPNPRVNGKGIRALREAGIDVRSGVLESECRKLNEVFSKFITTGLPFVTLKIAQTLDGRIADAKGRSRWISNLHSRTIVHALRARYDAVVVGASTIRRDNPRLTVRLVKGRNPWRVVLDGNFSAPLTANVFMDSERKHTLIFVNGNVAREKKGSLSRLGKLGVTVEAMPGKKGLLDLKKILKVLVSRGISSVLVEGGAFTYAEFLRSNLADKIVVFVAPKILGAGLSAVQYGEKSDIGKTLTLDRSSSWNLRGDVMIEAYLRK